MTVPAKLKGAKGDVLVARVEAPIIAAMVYGVYKFIELGVSLDHYLYTYIPLLGGCAATAGLFTYNFLVSMSQNRRWKNLFLLLEFLPYLYSLYVMGFLGVYMIYGGVAGLFSIWSVISGLFWVVVGYRTIYQFYLITQIVRRHDENEVC